MTGESIMREILEKMSMMSVDMGKANKAATKIMDAGSMVDPIPSVRFERALTSLRDALEKSETMASDLAWICKFRKMRDGGALDLPSAKAFQKNCAEVLAEVFDSMKGMRALMPAPPKGA